MQRVSTEQIAVRPEHHFVVFSGLLIVMAIGYALYTSKSTLAGFLVILVPLAVSIGMGVFTVKLQQRELNTRQVKYIVMCGWIGTLSTAAICGWMIALQYYNELPVEWLLDHILMLLSVGLGAGVLVGYSIVEKQPQEQPPEHPQEQPQETRSTPVLLEERQTLPANREQVLAESSWTERSGTTPILDAIVRAMAELQDVDPIELDPLYDELNPEVFRTLTEQTDSQWQLLFYVDSNEDTYEIRVSSFGTVTVYARR